MSSNKFRYTPSNNSASVPTSGPASTSTTTPAPTPTPTTAAQPSPSPNNQQQNQNKNLILPESARNATVDLKIFGTFAGPIPNEPTQTNTTNRTTNNNSNINTNNNNDNTPTLRLILGNRVNIPPSQK